MSRVSRPGVEVLLVPRQWVRLPGTDTEVLLHGRMRSAEGGSGIVVTRTGPPEVAGGWDLRLVYGLAYVRTARRSRAPRPPANGSRRWPR